jgi:hypothetical protein
MVLYVIGLGLGDEKDITVRGLEAVKRCVTSRPLCFTSQIVHFNQGPLARIELMLHPSPLWATLPPLYDMYNGFSMLFCYLVIIAGALAGCI